MVTLAAGAALGADTQSDGNPSVQSPVWATLTPFKNVSEFDEYRRRAHDFAKANGSWWASMRTRWRDGPLLAQVTPPCDPAVRDCPEELVQVKVTGLHGCAVPAIVHDQEPGVDEGDIVKTFDRFIIVLRHGRLSSLDTGGKPGELRLVDRIDTYPSVDPPQVIRELAIFGDTLLVAGRSAESYSSVYSLFRISSAGAFTLLARYFIAADDNLEWGEYSTRIVGGKLVFYSAISLAAYGPHEEVVLPRIRRWMEQGGFSEWRPLFDITDVYRPIQATLMPTLHVLSACAIGAGPTLQCRSRGVIGPSSQPMYVSGDNVYLWVESDWNDMQKLAKPSYTRCAPEADPLAGRGWPATVYRMNLASARLAAVHTEGLLSDRFMVDEQGGNLWALVIRERTDCTLIEEPGHGEGNVLARIPSAAFGTSPRRVPGADFIRVPDVGSYSVTARFTDGFLMFGAAQGAERAVYHDDPTIQPYRRGSLAVVPLASPDRAQLIDLPHSVDRIELFGRNALAFGYQPDDDFAVSSVILDKLPRIAGTQPIRGVVESLGNTPAFGGIARSDGSGIFGIPTLESAAYLASKNDETPTSVTFITANAKLGLLAADTLQAGEQDQAAIGYTCDVSCGGDWYGNSRPVFHRDRAFALLGEHVVEGALVDGRISEVARVDLGGKPANLRPATSN